MFRAFSWLGTQKYLRKCSQNLRSASDKGKMGHVSLFVFIFLI